MILDFVLDVSPTTLIIFFPAGILIYSLLQYIFDPLRSIPGPFLARFSRLWYFLEIYKGSFEETNIELHRRYGPIVRVAPHEYSIDDVDAARTIYGHGNAFVKVLFWVLQAGAGEMLIVPRHHGTRHGCLQM
jgi:hypothetical protein